MDHLLQLKLLVPSLVHHLQFLGNQRVSEGQLLGETNETGQAAMVGRVFARVERSCLVSGLP